MVTSMLLERDVDLAALGELVAGLDSAGGNVVLIRGEAGIGKSALVSAFVDSHADYAYVHSGACDDLFIPQPFGPFWDMARSEPSLKGPLADADRPRLLDALLDLLSRPRRPSLMIIEDMHWADEATLDAIRYVGRRIARTNGILVLTYRDGELDYDHPLRGVIGDIPPQHMTRIQLSGLSLTAVQTVVAESGLDPTDVLTATRGNPLLVTEMSSGAGGDVPTSLQDSLTARMAKLTIGSLEMLKTLAVIPEPIPREDAVRLPGVDEVRLEECVQRAFLEGGAEMVAFHHDLIRRAVESAMTDIERLTKSRAVLEGLPADTLPGLLVHCAVEADDVDRLLDLAPRSARYAAATGSHRQAVEDFREVGPYLDRLSPDVLGSLLDEWAREEALVDDIPEAIRLNELSRAHYQEAGDRRAESRALADAAKYHENAGQRGRALELARDAVDVLGTEPDGSDLARALEVNAYLQMMAGNVTAVPDLVDRTLEAGGPAIDEEILIRSLNHRGVVANIADYPAGRASLDEARDRAEAAGQWFEEGRALLNHAWAAAEFRDLPIASDYAQRAIASAVRHDLPTAYGKGMYARVLELSGEWDEAADLAREALAGSAIAQMVALPILGVLEARKGRTSSPAALTQAWEMASSVDEFQRLAPAVNAMAEYAWISGNADVAVDDLTRVMEAGLDLGFRWSTGQTAFWLWEFGELSEPPIGIAEPYEALITGDIAAASASFGSRGIPYERALALMHGSGADQLEALEVFETLGATAVAARHRRALRDRGVSVPRGRGRDTRRHAAGLTARQAEVLQLLADDLSNSQIADRLFVSPRTVESHVAAVFDKLDVTTREEAVSEAREAGLLTATGQLDQ